MTKPKCGDTKYENGVHKVFLNGKWVTLPDFDKRTTQGIGIVLPLMIACLVLSYAATVRYSPRCNDLDLLIPVPCVQQQE